jgi:hypothetical protein
VPEVLSAQNLKVVQFLGEPSEWDDNYGNTNTQYDLQVIDEQGQLHDVQWSKRASAQEPQLEEVVYAKLEDTSNGEYPPKLKTVRQDGQGGGQRQGGHRRQQGGQKKGGKGFDADDPYWKSQNAMKGRSAAQERAVGFVAAKVSAHVTSNDLLSENGVAALKKQLTPSGMRDLIDWFAADVEAAGKRGSASAGEQAPPAQAAPAAKPTPPPPAQPRADSGDLAPDTDGMEQPPPPDDDDIPF